MSLRSAPSSGLASRGSLRGSTVAVKPSRVAAARSSVVTTALAIPGEILVRA